jgi:hypothetical protein
MSQRTLKHGQVKGLKCPYCEVVAQRVAPGGWGDAEGAHDVEGGNTLSGLRAHMLVIHPELYERWVETWK